MLTPAAANRLFGIIAVLLYYQYSYLDKILSPPCSIYLTPILSHTKMAAIATLMAVALLRYASAQNITKTLILPDGLFSPTPAPQTFVGQMSVSDHATFYTLDCGNWSATAIADWINFWPGTYGCTNSNSYTFSADSANTEFLLPK